MLGDDRRQFDLVGRPLEDPDVGDAPISADPVRKFREAYRRLTWERRLFR